MSSADSARMDLLVEAATSLPWPVAEIDGRLLAWSRRAVEGDIDIRPVPAPPPDVTVLLSDNRFLVARRPVHDPITDEERRLLTALVAMATTSRHLARREARLRRQALTDDLTGLWRDAYFRELFDDLVDSRPLGESIGVLFLDIDRFKQINEHLGHLDADIVLREVGHRVRAALPADAIVARTGGDEFAAVVRDIADDAHLDRIAERVRVAVAAPLPVADLLMSIDVTIGTELSCSALDHPDMLLRGADQKMRHHKRRRPEAAPPRWYDERTVLREMLDQGLVEVAYQPIVDVEAGVVSGYEALVRGRHLEIGPVSPLMLVSSAVRLRMLDELTEVVVARAVSTISEVSRTTGRPLDLSVNVEFEQLRRESALLHSLPARLAGSGLRLILEVSERAVAPWTPPQLLVAHELAEAGIGLAVDDFGAGWSSLALLNSWAWTWVKIDRSLVSAESGEQGRTLLGHVARMLTDLNLTAVAEGIETPDELAAVRGVGLRLLQGNYFGEPAPAETIVSTGGTHGLGFRAATAPDRRTPG